MVCLLVLIPSTNKSLQKITNQSVKCNKTEITWTELKTNSSLKTQMNKTYSKTRIYCVLICWAWNGPECWFASVVFWFASLLALLSIWKLKMPIAHSCCAGQTCKTSKCTQCLLWAISHPSNCCCIRHHFLHVWLLHLVEAVFPCEIWFYWLSGLENWHHFLVKWYSKLKQTQAAQAYSLYFVWNFGSKLFIRLCMGIYQIFQNSRICAEMLK